MSAPPNTRRRGANVERADTGKSGAKEDYTNESSDKDTMPKGRCRGTDTKWVDTKCVETKRVDPRG